MTKKVLIVVFNCKIFFFNRLLAIAAMAVSVIWARRFAVSRLTNGLLLATAAATIAMLLLPSALWYHYLCVCLPVAAFSWHSAGRRERLWLFLGAAGVTLGLAWLPLAVAGAALMFVSAMVALNRKPLLSPALAR